MLTGEWGCGKTYLIKHQLRDTLKDSHIVVVVSLSKIVDPDAVWVLDDFGDDRITIITCTDDGTQRQVVVGLLD